jgi:glycosyltransferase involved in cell wall biosynthesis
MDKIEYLPKISVVTVSYNQAKFLEQTIISVINQNYPNLEYIVIDGGSEDESVDIIKQYADRINYWVSEPDGGQTNGLIKGFMKATGDIQCWINSDDMLEYGALIEVADFFIEHPNAQVVTGDAILIDEHGKITRVQKQIKFYRFLWIYDHNYITQSSTFWRRELYERVGGLDPAFDVSMDADLFIRFADVTELHHVRKLWSRFRLHDGQKSCNKVAEMKKESDIIRYRYIMNENLFSRQFKRVIAIMARRALKLCSGCYF